MKDVISAQGAGNEALISKASFVGFVRKYAMFVALIFIAILFEFLTDGVLLAPMNVSKLIMQNSYILILAVGMLPCILTGDIDLSVGSVLAVVGAIAATMIVQQGFSVPVTVGLVWHSAC